MRRIRAILAVALLATSFPAQAAENERDAWEALRNGAVVIFRHANAPGVGDPPGMVLDDCTTQRNLDPAGRAQARRIGEAFRARGIDVGAVLTSRWCRAAETAELAFRGGVRPEPAFDSFFSKDRSVASERTSAARRIISQWQGPGALVVVTHQVNVTALTGRFPASGEGVVLRVEGGKAAALGTIAP